jgi:aspartate racemase
LLNKAPTKRIGIIGGLSWESSSSYYTLLNQATATKSEPWQQPRVLLDSLDFREIVLCQQAGDWETTGRILADSARRLEAGGATVLAIGANTMHMNYEDVASAVSLPVLDVRDVIVDALSKMGASSLSLLGTKYVMTENFFRDHLEKAGVRVVVPNADQVEVLQSMIYQELTKGILSDESREKFRSIANDCRERGGEVVGLCCTEFGLLVGQGGETFPFIDSTKAHVAALLAH